MHYPTAAKGQEKRPFGGAFSTKRAVMGGDNSVAYWEKGLFLGGVGRGVLGVGGVDGFKVAGFDVVVIEVDGVAFGSLFDFFRDGYATDVGAPLAVEEDHVECAVEVFGGCVFMVGYDSGAVAGEFNFFDFYFGWHVFGDAVFGYLAKEGGLDVAESIGGLTGAVAAGIGDIVTASGIEVFLRNVFYIAFDGVAALHAEHKQRKEKECCCFVFHVLWILKKGQ